MAVVHYKFKNSVEYDSLTFDGLAISLRDLKAGILKKKHLRAEDTDLQIVNAQNGEEYSSPSMMIPKNTSLIIARIPVGSIKKTEDVTPQLKAMKWAAFRKETQAAINAAETGGYSNEKLKQSSDLVNAQSSEIEKIAEMIKQSTKDFDPSNYHYKFPTGTPSSSYICRRCGKGGHFIQNCTNDPLESSNSPSENQRMKRPTGIPVDSMVFVDEPLPGTYKTHTGKYAVPKIDVEAYAVGKKERPPFLQDMEKKTQVVKRPVPKELKCGLCGDLAKDAVVIPCCGISYCDECIRNKLLETDDHICPSCDSMDVSPDGLIPNQMLRRAVNNFQNETGYVKIAQNALKLAQSKAIEAAKAAAVATPVLKQSVIPRGPSVMDYKPPPRPPSPVQQVKPLAKASTIASVSSTQINTSSTSQQQPGGLATPQKSYIPASVAQEPPTPTLDEPSRSINYSQHSISSTVTPSISKVETVQSLVSNVVPVPALNRNQRPPVTSYDPYYKPPVVGTATHPPLPGVLPYPPPVGFPPPGVPPPFAPPSAGLPPPVVGPPVVPSVYPPPNIPRPSVPPHPLTLPKPLSEQEFWEEKNRLRREEERIRMDPMLEFQKELDLRNQKRYLSRSRSRSKSPIRSRSRSLSRSRYRSRSPRRRGYSRSPPRRSLTPRRSVSPRRSYSPRRYSPRRSRSPRYSPRRYSPRRSISPRPRYRSSYSRSPIRRRSLSRSRSRSWRRSPVKRSYSRSPIRRSPLKRSRSRGRYSSPRRSPFRPSLRRTRSRSFTPPKSFSKGRSPGRFSPKRRSPARGSKEKMVPRGKSPKPTKGGKKLVTKDSKVFENKNKSGDAQFNKNVNNNQNKSNEPNKENIPSVKPVSVRPNNIVVNLIEVSTSDDSNVSTKKTEDKVPENQNKDMTSVESSKAEVETSNKTGVEEQTGDKKESSNIDKKDEKPEQEISPTKESKPSAKTTSKTDKKVSDSRRRPRSRSKSKEKSDRTERTEKTNRTGRRKRSPPKKKEKSKSLSESPERVKEPLTLKVNVPYRREPQRFEENNQREGFNNRDWDRDRMRIRGDRDPYYRGRQNVGFRGRDFRGRGRNPDFRQDFRGRQNSDFRGGPPPPDFRGFPPMPPDPMGIPGTFPQQPPPGYPANFAASFPFPPRDPREDPNWQGMVRDEDIVKFEQYKQMYDFYSRTYGFPPSGGTSNVPSGQTPPQGPPPAPPGTTPLLSQDRNSSPNRRRSLSPRRRRSRSPGRRDGDKLERDYRDKRSPADRRRDERSDREDRSPDRKQFHSPDKKRTYSTDRRDVSFSDIDSSSPEKRQKDHDEKERKKDKKAKKRKEKGEGVEKKKKKKKDKEKSKNKKLKMEKKLKKSTEAESSDEEEEAVKVKKVKPSVDEESSDDEQERSSVKQNDSQNDSFSDKSDTEVKSKKTVVKKEQSSAQSESSDEETPVKTKKKKPKNIVKAQDSDKESVKSGTGKTNIKTEVEDMESEQPEIGDDNKTTNDKVKEGIESSATNNDVEMKEVNEKQEKRRSLKRSKAGPPDVSESIEKKKAKLEQTTTVKEENTNEKSPGGSDGLDDIPPLEDELMLDPPELSKWEKDDDPYDLSPEPSRIKEKPKKTFLPRSIIEKAEHALAQKVMKPTTVSSAVSVIPSNKKEIKSEIKEQGAVSKKRDKSPIGDHPQRRVFMDSNNHKEERKISSKQHNVKITVTGDEKRRVAAGEDKKKGNAGVDLRAKLSEKRREKGHARDLERDVYDRNIDKKRKNDSGNLDRRSSRDYDRQDSRSSKNESGKNRSTVKMLSRKESVIDDSRFEPDYEDESLSEDNVTDDSSSDSSSDEEYVKRKHKHKKNKHKKDKKQKKKKEKKKKKHKVEKEKKVKSSHSK